ncbi:hypothetical protein vseg_005442 [Gypsophila vaccaria]
MVKGVVGEEGRLSSVEERLANSGAMAEVGLVIGKLSRELDRGFVFDLVATPSSDAGQPPCSLVGNNDDTNKSKSKNKKTSNNPTNSSSSTLVIDVDWVAEHARQVSRMMVGGIKVIGVYLWAPEAAFKNSTLLLSQTVKGVAGAAPLCNYGSDERLLLHICYSPRRWTCRSCSLASNITSSSLRPCDFKMGRVLSSLQAFRCMYKIDMRLPIFSEKISDMNDTLRDGISIHAKELNSALAMVDGELVDENEDVPCKSDDMHEVELLLPFVKDGSLEASSQNDVVGVLVFCGTICTYSYLSSKEPVSQAVADLKEDIIMSLRSRLDIIFDEAEREMAAASGDGSETNNEMSDAKSLYAGILNPLRKEIILPFPRRVFIPWLAGSFVCDYLLPRETFEVVKEHFVEILSMEIPDDASVLEPEKELPNPTSRSFWDVAAPSHGASDGRIIESNTRSADKKAVSITRNFGGMLAVFVLLIAVLLGSLLFARNSSEM